MDLSAASDATMLIEDPGQLGESNERQMGLSINAVEEDFLESEK